MSQEHSPATNGLSELADDLASGKVILALGNDYPNYPLHEAQRMLVEFMRSVPSETPQKLTAKELDYSMRLHGRILILRERLKSAQLPDPQEITKELHALEWAVQKITITSALSATPQKPDPLSPPAITAEAARPDPMQELATYIKESIRLCDHGYIHITCGRCTAPGLQP